MVFIQRIVNFLAAFFASLDGGFSEFAILPLQILDISLILLCLHHVIGLVLGRVRPKSTVTADSALIQVNALDLVVRLLSHIPVPHIVKVDVAHLIAKHLGDYLAVLDNLTGEVVHRPILIVSDFVPGLDAILLILEVTLATNQVDQGAPNRI